MPGYPKAHSFFTLQSASEAVIKEKSSKFLSFAYPIESEEDVKERLKELKKRFLDASHHCYAYRLGPDHLKFRAVDDGEPSHSAGDPILGQIRAANLTNVLVVVVRYFGGTKLGIGGLVLAYKLAAAEALRQAVIVEKDVMITIDLRYEYSATSDVMRLVKDFQLGIRQQDFEEECKMIAEIKMKYLQAFQQKVSLMCATGTRVKMDHSQSEKKY